MFGPVRASAAQLILAFGLSICLITSPLLSITPVRAEVKVEAASLPTAQQITRPHKVGEILIKLRETAPTLLREQVIDAFAKKQRKLRGRGKLLKLTLKDHLDVSGAIFNLKQLANIVEWAEPNYIVAGVGTTQQSPTPNDAQYGTQWALANTGQGGGAPGADIGAQGGWVTTTGSRDTIVAVIDTGIDRTHPDLANNLWKNKREQSGTAGQDDDRDGFVDDVEGWNFVSDNNNVQDDHGHGTQVTGIIAAEGNNSVGMSGVMWQASLMPLKALDATGSGSISDVVEAIDFAIEHGASVINCSFGTPGFSQSLLDAINRAAFSGTLVVASAGNEAQDLGTTPYYPASYTAGNLIAVAATTNEDQLAGFSNWSVQIAAPGVNILTTQRGGGYTNLTGTSAAAPLVAGVAGLLKTLRGWSSAQHIRRILTEGVRPIPHLAGKVSSGGIVSATKSATALKEEVEGNGQGGDEDPPSGNGGGGNPGGGGPGGGQSGLFDLDYMRTHAPQKPEPRVTINSVPNYVYDDPMPNGGGSGSGAFDSYYGLQVTASNAVGEAGNKPRQHADPTDPGQTTSQQSVNFGSQNVNFSAPVLGLKGRGGLDLALALNYNSKVWTAASGLTKMVFNGDKGFPGPGWRTGFGVIQGKNNGGQIGPYYSYTTNSNSFIYIAPDGARIDLAYNSTSGLYESYDSSYIDFNASSKVLRMPNGTQILFGTTYDYQFLPTEIKDKNGNKITITNSTIVNGDGIISNGDVTIDYITDTLGRQIDFYYEGNRLRKVRQNRGGVWFDYAVIDYTQVTIATNFGMATDPSPLTSAWVPSEIKYPAGQYYRFYYTSYAQMYLVEKWAPYVPGQGSERRIGYTRYDFPSYNGQSYPANSLVALGTAVYNDSPKFGRRFEQGENWNAGAEAEYIYSFNGSGTSVKDPTGRLYVTEEDGNASISKVFENDTKYSQDLWSKKTTTYYQWDGSGYQSNLRVSDVRVESGTNVRRTVYTYSTGNVKLPIDIEEYDGANIYRHTQTDYHTGYPYSNFHIYGLPTETRVYKGSGTSNLIAKTGFNYDEAGYFDSTSYTVPQHDSTSYYAGYYFGRGNLTSVTQYEVPGNGTKSTHTKYDMTGSVVATYDGLNHATLFYYNDNYVNGPGSGVATHAYVTKIKDPDGYWSGAQYNYYNGAVTQNYHLQGQNGTGTGAVENIVSYGYDAADRPITVSRPDGGLTTRDYWDNWLAQATYTKSVF